MNDFEAKKRIEAIEAKKMSETKERNEVIANEKWVAENTKVIFM